MNDMKNRTDRNLMVKSFIPNKSMIVAEFIYIYYLVPALAMMVVSFPKLCTNQGPVHPQSIIPAAGMKGI